MPKVTIYIQSSNEPNIILVKFGNLKTLIKNETSLTLIFKYAQGNRFTELVFDKNVLLKIENGFSKVENLHSDYFGYFIRRSENTDFRFQ